MSIVLLLAILLACSTDDGPPLLVKDVEITLPMPGMSMSAGYLTLHNNSKSDIRITQVTSPQFDAVEIHETIVENDIARMRRVDELLVAPGETVRLERRGLHLMLKEAKEDISTVNLSLYSDDLLLLTLTTRTEETS
jgi:copper(I)-binding protein